MAFKVIARESLSDVLLGLATGAVLSFMLAERCIEKSGKHLKLMGSYDRRSSEYTQWYEIGDRRK
ncbi:MAG: hypothetical protein OXD31_17300 [Chloroflexi bacterium]|nr:hypothetical protein [Chloroflexota bacterium]